MVPVGFPAASSPCVTHLSEVRERRRLHGSVFAASAEVDLNHRPFDMSAQGPCCVQSLGGKCMFLFVLSLSHLMLLCRYSDGVCCCVCGPDLEAPVQQGPSHEAADVPLLSVDDHGPRKHW